MKTPIPIIDLFAGPGGLGEGFSSYKLENGQQAFKINLSIEKEIFAHRTLELRAFYRQFIGRLVPPEYYEYLRGEINHETLFAKYPHEASMAQKEAWKAVLGEQDREEVKLRINQALNGVSNWVLIGGPPCQAYSLVGRSRMIGNNREKYEADPRHYLYKEYLRILADHHPPVFVMENVKGLLSAKLHQQKTFDLILSDLRDPSSALGMKSKKNLCYKLFSVSHKSPANPDDIKPEDFIVRSEDYSIPQSRHRIIILGIRYDFFKSAPDILTKSEQIAIEEVIGDLPKLRSGLSKETDSAIEWQKAIRSIKEAKWLLSVSPTLRKALINAMEKVGKNLGRGQAFLPFKASPKKHQNWYVDSYLSGVCNHETRAHIRSDLHRYFFASVFANEMGRSPTLSDFPTELLPDHQNVDEAIVGSKFSDRFRVQVYGRPSTTVVSHISKDGHYYIHYDPTQCRSLTVREAARLQTFPDDYYFEGNRTEQYTQVGNAVPPLLAYKIATTVFKVLHGSQ